MRVRVVYLQFACLLIQVVYILPLLSDLLQDLVH